MSKKIEIGDAVQHIHNNSWPQNEHICVWEVTSITPNDHHRAGPEKDYCHLKLIAANPPFQSRIFRDFDWWDKRTTTWFREDIVLVNSMMVLALAAESGLPPIIKHPCPRWCGQDHDHGWPDNQRPPRSSPK